MVELIKKISAVLLAFVVFVSTSGFIVYEHQCGCCQTTDYSLVDFTSCCDEHTDVADETAADVCGEGVCCSASVEKNQGHLCSADGCCNFDNNYEKLSVEFDKTQTVSLRSFPQILNTIQILKPQFLVVPLLTRLIHISQNAPPLLSEADFVIFTHALKIPF
jgi:hypothetical protein